MVHKCTSNWGNDKCRQVWEQIQQNLDDGHVWKTNGYNFQLNHKSNSISIKKLAFQASIFRHFQFSKPQQETCKSGFCIAHYHFSEKLSAGNPVCFFKTRMFEKN